MVSIILGRQFEKSNIGHTADFSKSKKKSFFFENVDLENLITPPNHNIFPLRIVRMNSLNKPQKKDHTEAFKIHPTGKLQK